MIVAAAEAFWSDTIVIHWHFRRSVRGIDIAGKCTLSKWQLLLLLSELMGTRTRMAFHRVTRSIPRDEDMACFRFRVIQR